MKKLGLYIHIPFCERKCDYCNFISFNTTEDVKEKYVDYLLKEMSISAKNYSEYQIDSIFIGGGTPSCLRPKSIINILNFIMNNFNVCSDAEITVEANPNSLTLEKLREFKLAGVTRLSVGLQAYNNKLLKLIGRLHNKKQFNLAIKNAKKIGFENINVDILLGLPNQKLKDVKLELKHLVKLKIPHISAYGLIVEDNTKLSKNLQDKVYCLPKEETSLKMYEFTLNYLKKHKINRYEVSNFAKNGYESKHNLKYWTMQNYVGFGLSSHSFFEEYRWENVSNLSNYFSMLDKNQLPIESSEKQSVTDLKEEFIMTELRKADGFEIEKYNNMFNANFLQEKDSQINNLINQKLIKIENGKLFATNRGFELLNQIILELI